MREKTEYPRRRVQDVIAEWAVWLDGLTRESRLGPPLGTGAKLVSGKQARIITDGPFAETKEAIGG